MHTEDGDEDSEKIADYYGIWPTLIGLLFGAGLTWFMFAMADGFTSLITTLTNAMTISTQNLKRHSKRFKRSRPLRNVSRLKKVIHSNSKLVPTSPLNFNGLRRMLNLIPEKYYGRYD